jgi:uncharacterized membrane protein
VENFQNIKAERVKQFFVVLATLCIIFINNLAGSRYINDKTHEAISEKYPTLLTPDAAIVIFTVFSVITLFIVVIYSLLQTKYSYR